MPSKPNTRNWNDVQVAIATGAIAVTLGLWNLFAQPANTVNAQAVLPTITPPPTEPPMAVGPSTIPQAKIIFTQTAPRNVVITQQQQSPKKNNNNNGGGGGTVTQTKTS
ncbi:MAG: hypothetical protein IPP66_02280 [Anaerolineales bacterium]|nr:hypothetical protein [Anaerolineales bacterium]